jgi:hypothetical protein
MAKLISNSPFLILIPTAHRIEIDWLLEWVFGRLESFSFEKKYHDENYLAFIQDDKKLILPQVFFKKAKLNWLSIESLPESVLNNWLIDWPELESSLIDSSLPILYGSEGLLQIDEKNYVLNLDVLGSSFFLLTRYEEFVNPCMDIHHRFLASDSIAFKSGFLERPLADEYVLVLFASLKKIWPQLCLNLRKSEFQISHDVDVPALYAFKSFISLVKPIIRNLINGEFKKVGLIFLCKLMSKTKIYSSDPFNNFEWIMNQIESIDAKSTFYFLTGRHNEIYDGDYEVDHPAILNLISELNQRGHRIGLHPSYDAATNFDFLSEEQIKLNNAKKKISINTEPHGARMHFLRWLGPQTWHTMAQIGLEHDASLGFADHVGFRCGTCHPYQAFDVINHIPVQINVYPLTVMEVSVIDTVYMSLGTGDAAFLKIDQIRKACKKVNGVFTILWHNSRLVKIEEKNLFQKVLKTM